MDTPPILRCFIIAISVALMAERAVFSQDSDLTTEELVAAYTDNVSSINTIFCEYTVQYGQQHPLKRRYARSSSMWHLTDIRPKNGFVNEVTVCCDGQAYYSYSISRMPSGDKSGTVQIHDVKKLETLHPEVLLGENLSNISRSLASVLVEGTSNEVVVKTQHSDGANSYLLTARNILADRVGEEMKYDVVATLDELYGFLPISIRISESDENVTSPGWVNHWKISDFIDIVDGRTGEKRWFPLTGILDQGSTPVSPGRKKPDEIKMVTSLVRINADLPISLFRPEIPDGQQVADVTSGGTGRIGIKGGDAAIDKRIEELTAASRESIQERRVWPIAAVSLLVIMGLCLVVWRKVFK